MENTFNDLEARHCFCPLVLTQYCLLLAHNQNLKNNATLKKPLFEAMVLIVLAIARFQWLSMFWAGICST